MTAPGQGRDSERCGMKPAQGASSMWMNAEQYDAVAYCCDEPLDHIDRDEPHRCDEGRAGKETWPVSSWDRTQRGQRRPTPTRPEETTMPTDIYLDPPQRPVSYAQAVEAVLQLVTGVPDDPGAQALDDALTRTAANLDARPPLTAGSRP